MFRRLASRRVLARWAVLVAAVVAAPLLVAPASPATAAAVGTISGRVVSAAGGALASARVELSYLDPGTGTEVLVPGSFRRVRTDGTFTFTDLPPRSSYRLFAQAGGHQPVYWPAGATPAQGQAITVTAGGTARIGDVSLQPSAPGALTRPTITGKPQLGATLTADPGTWTASDPTFSYLWFVDGRAITSATQRTYVPTAGTLGKTLTVQVTARVPGRSPGVAVSDPTPTITGSGTIEVVRAPTLTGRAVVGQTLGVDRGYWTPSGLTWSYVWVRDGQAISGARSSTYTLTSADWGRKVAVKVYAVRSGYSMVSRYTPAVDVKRTPAMSNTAEVLGGGQVRLTAKIVVTGATNPVGDVVVFEDGEVVATMPTLVKGVSTIVLQGRTPGQHTYTLAYAGNRLVEAAARSRTVTVG